MKGIDFPRELKGIRKSLRLSQGAFAELIGLSEKTIQNYERGLHLPSLKKQNDILGAARNVKIQDTVDHPVSGSSDPLIENINLKKRITDLEEMNRILKDQIELYKAYKEELLAKFKKII